MKRLLLIALSVISALTLCIALTACKEDGKIDIAYEKVYTITYDYDGDLMRGGVKLTSKTETVKENEISSFTLPAAVKKGYGFSGWLNNGEVFTTASFGSELTLKLTPEFTSRSYVFNYNHEGDLMRGDESAAKSETVAFSDLSGFTLPTAIKRGYTFKRWLNGDEEFDLSALDEDATYNLTPEFTVNTYTIIYGFDGDVLRDGVKLISKTETVAFDKLSDYKLPVAAKKGYTFDKWMNGTMPFDKSGVDASATFTLMPSFDINSYSVTYYLTEDDAQNEQGAILTETVEYEDNYAVKYQKYLIENTDIVNDARFNYDIIGWKISDGENYVGGTYEFDCDIKLVAVLSNESGTNFKVTLWKGNVYIGESDATFNEVLTIDFPSQELSAVKKGYHLTWKNAQGEEIVSGDRYGYRYSMKLYLTEEANQATVNFVVVGGDTARFINLKTDSATLSTGGEHPTIQIEANDSFAGGTVSLETSDGKTFVKLKKTDNKVYVYELKWSLEEIGNEKPTKFYDTTKDVIVENDGSVITLYAFFDELIETPNA